MTVKFAGRECNLELLGIPCYTSFADELDAATVAALEEAVARARDGGYRRWIVEIVDGSGGYSIDFPAEWDVLRVMQEVAYVHGERMEAHPARAHRWVPVSDSGPHFVDGDEIPTGAYNWFQPWDVKGPRGPVSVSWPRAWEGGTDLLDPDPEPQLALPL